jgi:hypothetical protein
MGIPVAIFLGCVYVRALWRPAICLALLMLMFGVKIVMQSQFGVFQAESGTLLVNVLTALVIAASIAILRTRHGSIDGGFLNPTSILSIALYLWSIITLGWSLAPDSGFAIVQFAWPYVVLALIMVPIAVRNLEGVGEALVWARRVGFVLSLIILVSPEFTSKSGRIGIDLATSASSRSNPLVIGEIGAMQIMLGFLLTTGRRTTLELLFRIACVLVGTIVVFKSGSRGQIFFAIGLSLLFYPVSFRVASIRSFFAGVVMAGILASIAYLFTESLLSDWELRRFSFEALLYGSSSAGSRFAAVLSMAQEWASTPRAWLFGLGLNSYSALPLGTGDIYSHVVFADAIFELGLIGFALLAWILWIAVRSCRTILAYAVNADPAKRSTASGLVCLIVFQTLLVNKQGALWGSYLFFGLLVVANFVAAAIPAADPAEHVIDRSDELAEPRPA